MGDGLDLVKHVSAPPYNLLQTVPRRYLSCVFSIRYMLLCPCVYVSPELQLSIMLSSFCFGTKNKTYVKKMLFFN